MKSVSVIVCVVFFGFVCSLATAADESKEAASKSRKGLITGRISVTKTEKGKLESITLAGDNGTTYRIATKGKGAAMAKEADGETVQVKGSAKTKKGKDGESTWLSVKSYSLVFSGTVVVEKKGKTISKIKLGDYDVRLDGKARKMAAKAEGKDVMATGSKSIRKTKKGKEVVEVVTIAIKDFSIKGE